MSNTQIPQTSNSLTESSTDLSEAEAVRRTHAFMAHRTESGRLPWMRYKLAAAGGNSGYSVGQIQVDLRGSEHDRAKLARTAASWLVKQGKIHPQEQVAWEKEVSGQLEAKASEGKLTKSNKDFLNDFLASAEGNHLVDKMSRDFFDAKILPRLNKIFAHPSTKLLVKDPQFVAYATKIANSGNGEEFNSFLAGNEVELGGEPQMPTGQSKIVAPSALKRAFIGGLKQPVAVTINGEEVTLPAETRIEVSAEGLFALSPKRAAIALGKNALRLTIPDASTTRPRFLEGGAEMGIDIEPNSTLSPEVVISKKEQKDNKSATLLDFKNASVFSYAKIELSEAQKNGDQPLMPGAFFQEYASKNMFSDAYRKALRDIYYVNPGQYQSADAQPQLLLKTNNDLWQGLDPEGYLLPSLRKVIEDEHAIENRGQVRLGLKPIPLTRDRVEMYMKTNQAVMAAAVRLQPPAPQDATTPDIYYPNATGGKAFIRYRVDPKLLKNGQVGLMRLLRENRDMEIDVSPANTKLPSKQIVVQPQKTWQKIDEARWQSAPPSVVPVQAAFTAQPLPQPIALGGPEPLQRLPGPSREERAQIEADERTAAALAAFDRDQDLRGIIAAEVAQQLKPPPGRSRFEEAVLCGYSIYS